MRHSGKPISAYKPAIQAQIDAALHPPRDSRAEVDAKIAKAFPGGMLAKLNPAPKRLRQSSKGPNKTEAAFAFHLRGLHPGKTILEQAVTLVLANGVRYTPDVFLPDHFKRPSFYEVKGFMRTAGAVKVKVAADAHRWADFYLVTKRKKAQGGGWSVEMVMPLPV